MTKVLTLLLFLAGCTTVGYHTSAIEQYRFQEMPKQTVRICLYTDADSAAARAWIEDASEFALYNLELKVVETYPWARGSFALFGTHMEMLNQIAPLFLHQSCDRVIAAISHSTLDTLMLLLGQVVPIPHVFGVVSDRTGTHGFVTYPLDWVRDHEFYHMIGCEHAITKDACYERIALLKRESTPEFFASWSFEQKKVLHTRREVLEAAGYTIMEQM